MHATIAILVLAIAVVVVFVTACLTDLARGTQPRYLPRWVWVIIICLSIPWGGLAYLLFGRAGRRGTSPDTLAPVPVTVPAAPLAAGAPLLTRRTPVSPASIELNQLTKRFGSVTALDGLSFTVSPGKVTGFLGRYQEIIRPLHEVGSLLDATALPGGRSAWFHLLALARSNGIGQRRVKEVLEQTGLEGVASRRAALLADPGSLMLDEPVNGLDAEGVRWMRQLLTSLAAEGRTVLVSSHLMSEMAMIADHLIIIGRGRLLADTPAAGFVSSARRDVLVKSPRAGELAALLSASGATVRPEGGGVAVAGLGAACIGDLALAHGIAIHELVPWHASLEDAYLDLTSDSTDYHATTIPAGRGTVP
jgi:ABC-2 type transport system ATP-binding protein